jgi:hypothetical protein
VVGVGFVVVGVAHDGDAECCPHCVHQWGSAFPWLQLGVG